MASISVSHPIVYLPVSSSHFLPLCVGRNDIRLICGEKRHVKLFTLNIFIKLKIFRNNAGTFINMFSALLKNNRRTIP